MGTLTDNAVLNVDANTSSAQSGMKGLDEATKRARVQIEELDDKNRELNRGLNELLATQQKLKSENKQGTEAWKRNQEAIKSTRGEINKNKTAQKALRQEIGLQGMTIAEVSKQLRGLKAQLRNATPETKEWERLNAQVERYNERLKELRGQSARAGQSVERSFGSRTTGLISKANVAVAAVAASLVGVVAAGSKILEVRAKFQQFAATLQNTLGSRSEAQAALKEIQGFVATTPFQVDEVTESYVKLSNAGLRPGLENLRQYGDIAASQGKSFDQFTEALIDAAGALEFERLKEFGIRASRDGDVVRFTFKGITTEVQATSEGVQQYIASLGDLQGVSGSTAAISQTLNGQLSNLQDSFTNLLNVVGTRLEPVFKSLISTAQRAVGFFTELVDNSRPLNQELSNQRAEVNLLVKSITSLNEDNEVRNQLLAELQTKYPEFLKNINAETATNADLLEQLEAVNAEYEKRIQLAVVQDELVAQEGELRSIFEQQREIVKQINQVFESALQSNPALAEATATLETELQKIGQAGLSLQDKLSFLANAQLTQTDLFRAQAAEYSAQLDELEQRQAPIVQEINGLIGEQIQLNGQLSSATDANTTSTNAGTAANVANAQSAKELADELAALEEQYIELKITREDLKQSFNEAFLEEPERFTFDVDTIIGGDVLEEEVDRAIENYKRLIENEQQFAKDSATILGAYFGTVTALNAKQIITEEDQNEARKEARRQVVKDLINISLDALQKQVTILVTGLTIETIASSGILAPKTLGQIAAIQAAFAATRAVVNQFEKGTYNVMGADDGKQYNNVPYIGTPSTGIYNKPALFAESGREAIFPATALAKPVVYNYVQKAIAADQGRVKQYQTGNVADVAVNTPELDIRALNNKLDTLIAITQNQKIVLPVELLNEVQQKINTKNQRVQIRINE